MNRTLSVCFILVAWLPLTVTAKSPKDAQGRVMSFSRDVAPILSRACLDCHGPQTAKNDFRVDHRDSFLSYISPEDLAGSSLWTDYLVTEDEEMLMPPTSKGGPLSPVELAVLRTWIAEGAHWPEEEPLIAGVAPAVKAVLPASRHIGDRLWAFQGYFHPAVVHFPIALLSVGGLFVMLGWISRDEENQVAYYLLVLGAISAIVAAAMGWSFAFERGFGGWDRTENAPFSRVSGKATVCEESGRWGC
jgi:hypothetical protein